MQSDGLKSQPKAWRALEQLETRTLLSLSFIEHPLPSTDIERNAVFADFDADGDIDTAFFLMISEFQGGVRVMLSNGDGSFADPVEFPTLSGRVTPGDFDGDGIIDLLIGSSPSNQIFPGVGNGTFGPSRTFTVPMTGILSLTDFGGDGFMDVIEILGDGRFRTVENQGLGGFFRQLAIHTFDEQINQFVGVADFNGDSIDDIAVWGSGLFQVWFGDGGDFAPGPISIVESKPAVGDFDGDGLADLAWTTIQPGATTAIVRRAINPGTGQFLSSSVVGTAPEFLTQGVPQAVDIDGDGSLDLAVAWLVLQTGVFQPVDANVVMYAGDGAGGFSEGVELFTTMVDSFGVRVTIQWADISGDGALDAIAIGKFGAGQIFVSRASPPVIGSIAGPTTPVTPGLLFTISALDVTATSGRTISRVQVFEDTNGNGTYDNDPFGVGPDLLFADAAADGSIPRRWAVETILQDDALLGLERFFVVATDSRGSASEALSVDVNFWTRLYFPEGWRSDATVSETLRLASMLNQNISYRVIARYESGVSDVQIAQGVLSGFEKKDIILSERGNPSAALVRAGVGYAIEVQTSSVIGATLLREENFGAAGEADRVITVEALDNSAAARWGFIDVSTSDHDFLLFYNPFERDTTLSVTFSHATLPSVVIPQRLDAFRRGGLNLREIAALVPGEDYMVEITSADPIAAAMSRYADSGGAGFTSLGQQFGASTSFNWVTTDQGDSTSLVLFNPLAQAISVSVTITFDDPGATVHAMIVPLEPGARHSIDLTPLTPAEETTVAGIRMTASESFYSHTTSLNSLRPDVIQRSSPASHAWQWLFSGTSLTRGGTDNWITITNSSNDPNRVTWSYRLLDRSDNGSITLGAHETRRVNLGESFFRTSAQPLGHFRLSGERNFFASLTHTDAASGLRWETMGTTSSRITPL